MAKFNPQEAKLFSNLIANVLILSQTWGSVGSAVGALLLLGRAYQRVIDPEELAAAKEWADGVPDSVLVHLPN